MKTKRIIIAVFVLILTLAMACALVACDDNKHTLLLETNNDSYGKVQGGGEYKEGDSVTIIAAANEGYSFSGWYYGEKLLSIDTTYTFTMGNMDIKYSARFTINSYKVVLNCDATQGEFTGSGEYKYDSRVTIKANAYTGYSFVGWYDGDKLISDKAEYSFTMGAFSVTYTARFIELLKVTLDYNRMEGSVTGGGYYYNDSNVTIKATAKEGYAFIGWYEGETLVSEKAEYTISNISENIKYTAKFNKLKFNVELNYDTTLGHVSGGGEYYYGDTIILQAEANEGYVFIGWYEGETLISEDAVYAISNISDNKTYTARFSLNKYSVNIEYDASRGSVTGGGDYDYCSIVTLSATEKLGYLFYGWYIGENRLSEQNDYSLNMDANNINIIAEFLPDPNYEDLILESLDDGTYMISGIKNRNFYDISIPKYVSVIGPKAFINCWDLKYLTIPNSVKSIGTFAFQNCGNISRLNYHGTIAQWLEIDGLENLMRYSSYKSLYIEGKSIEELTIPDGVTSISDFAFSGCSDITSIILPNSVTVIGSYAFAECSSLTSITIPNSVTCIADSMFYGCTSLTSLTIPDRVTVIGSHAFVNCSSLTNITIPDSVTNIRSFAFSGCTNLESLIFENTTGWIAVEIPVTDDTNGTSIDVSDPSLNAIYWKGSTSLPYYWRSK